MVFEDPTSRRWRRAVVIAGVAGLLVGAVLALAVALGLAVPPLPAVSEQLPARVPGLVASRMVPAGDGEAAAGGVGGVASARAPVRAAYAASRPLGMGDPFLAAAFVAQADPRSVIDLDAHLADLDVVFPDWFRFDTADGAVVETIDADVLARLRSSEALVMPRVTNLDADDRWRPDVFRALARDTEARWELIGQLLNRTRAAGGHGLNVDIEGLAPEDATLFLEWLSDLTARFHEAGLYVTVDLPVRGEAYDYELIGRMVDAVVVMGYDEHFTGGQAGPIASRDWFSAAIDELTHRVPVNKLIVGLGGYGYDWRVGSPDPARVLSFAEAMSLAAEFGAWVETDGTALNSTFAYTDYDGVSHQVWLLDAVSAWNQMALVREWGARGVALWRLGLEEPTLWRFFAGDALFAPEELASVESWDGILRAGKGDLLRVTGLPADGERSLSVDRGIIDHAAYTLLPSYFVVGNYGGRAGRQVALTFDDGPDRRWTPALLDVLRRHAVPATFFVLGERVGQMPDLVRRAVDDGHLIGNHTFGHPDLRYSTDLSLRRELNTTQRLIEAAIGRQTVLFRAPYNTDSAPTAPDELRPLYHVTRLGYLVAGGDVDSLDYTRPGTDAIVQHVLDGVAADGVHVVTLHDAGGDRSQTVAAVDRLIPLLKASSLPTSG
jgi:spore germination protein YaaH/peptidoglycan/xylan/chitin deacetylase (PgdA/CDA1 family)